MTEFEKEKLDKMMNRLDEALVRLTTMEEKTSQNVRSLERAFNSIDELKEKTQRLETSQAISQSKIGMNERVVWMIISAAIGVVAYSLKV
jgi:hypothetical protein